MRTVKAGIAAKQVPAETAPYLKNGTLSSCPRWPSLRVKNVRAREYIPVMAGTELTYGGLSAFRHPLDGLLKDPGLLEDEVWRLFTVPGVASWLEDKWHPWLEGRWRRGTCWQDALAALSEQGRLDRDRLLDACLDAFSRDFAPNQVGWYVTFHDRMSPSLDDMAARASRYIGLLDLIARYGLPEGPERLTIGELAGSLAPALEHRAAALGLPGGSPVAAAERLIEVPDPARVEPAAGDRLPPPLEDPGS